MARYCGIFACSDNEDTLKFDICLVAISFSLTTHPNKVLVNCAAIIGAICYALLTELIFFTWAWLPYF